MSEYEATFKQRRPFLTTRQAQRVIEDLQAQLEALVDDRAALREQVESLRGSLEEWKLDCQEMERQVRVLREAMEDAADVAVGFYGMANSHSSDEKLRLINEVLTAALAADQPKGECPTCGSQDPYYGPGCFDGWHGQADQPKGGTE